MLINNRGYLIGSTERINNSKDIKKLFADKIEHVYFDHFHKEDKSIKEAKIIVIFQTNKN